MTSIAKENVEESKFSLNFGYVKMGNGRKFSANVGYKNQLRQDDNIRTRWFQFGVALKLAHESVEYFDLDTETGSEVAKSRPTQMKNKIQLCMFVNSLKNS
jgi:hypothetical protein